MSEIDIFSHAPVAMAVVGCDGKLLRVNRALSDMLGDPPERLIGRTLDSLSHPDDAGRTAAKLRNLLDDTSARFQLEVQYLPLQRSHLVGARCRVARPERQGVPVSFLAHVQDFSERQELAVRMAYLADHDALTGLFTRRCFDEMLARHRRRCRGRALDRAMLVLDLNRFKSVNDTSGPWPVTMC